MFSSPQPSQTEPKVEDDILKQTKYKSVIQPIMAAASIHEEKTETSLKNLDAILERETHKNSSDSWNKLNKTIKMQKLHQFAETYGSTNKLPQKDIKSLKLYFNDCLDKNKLQRAKDLAYDKEKGVIVSIPGLLFNVTNRSFTIRASENAKRVSSLKSLAPKKQMSTETGSV
jgi:hypothetical protein